MLRFFYSAVQVLIILIVGFFLVGLGLTGVLLPWSTYLQDGLIQLILEDSTTASLLGAIFLSLGLFCLFYLYLNFTRKHYHVPLFTRAMLVTVNQELIEKVITDYLQQAFPDYLISFTLALRRSKMKLTVDMPKKTIEEQQTIIETLQQGINQLLRRQLGFPYPCDLHVRFSSN